jgi:hypothetical protein
MLEPIDGWTLSEWEMGPAEPVLIGPDSETVGVDPSGSLVVTTSTTVVAVPMKALQELLAAHEAWCKRA